MKEITFRLQYTQFRFPRDSDQSLEMRCDILKKIKFVFRLRFLNDIPLCIQTKKETVNWRDFFCTKLNQEEYEVNTKI